MFSRSIYLLICSLVLAGIVHITIVLLIPLFSKQDVAKKILGTLPNGGFHTLAKFPETNIKGQDPFFKSVVCKFDLTEDSYLIEASRFSEFWSASVYNANGQVVYSLNDKTAIRNQLRVLIVNSVQWAKLRKLQDPELEKSILVEMNSPDGFIVLRALVRDESFTGTADAFFNSAKCQTFQPS